MRKPNDVKWFSFRCCCCHLACVCVAFFWSWSRVLNIWLFELPHCSHPNYAYLFVRVFMCVCVFMAPHFSFVPTVPREQPKIQRLFCLLCFFFVLSFIPGTEYADCIYAIHIGYWCEFVGTIAYIQMFFFFDPMHAMYVARLSKQLTIYTSIDCSRLRPKKKITTLITISLHKHSIKKLFLEEIFPSFHSIRLLLSTQNPFQSHSKHAWLWTLSHGFNSLCIRCIFRSYSSPTRFLSFLVYFFFFSVSLSAFILCFFSGTKGEVAFVMRITTFCLRFHFIYILSIFNFDVSLS